MWRNIEFEASDDDPDVQVPILRPRIYSKKIVWNGIQAIGAGAFAAYTWKTSYHPSVPFVSSIVALQRLYETYKNFQKYVQEELTFMARERVYSRIFLTTGTITYATNVYAFSRALKDDSLVRLVCAVTAVSSYFVATKRLNTLGKLVFNRSRTGNKIFKCCQLLFAPSLIGGAAYYLLNVQGHDEKWMCCLPLLASAAAANNVTLIGYRKRQMDGPNWMLHKGIYLLVGGSLLCIISGVLLVYAVNEDFHLVLCLSFVTMMIVGLVDIIISLACFQRCVEVSARLFSAVCGLIVGPIVFSSACLGVICMDSPSKFLPFITIAGTGISIILQSSAYLYMNTPWPMCVKYHQQLLGPLLTVYSSLASAYVGYHKGWKFSIRIVPFVATGIYLTYRGLRGSFFFRSFNFTNIS